MKKLTFVFAFFIAVGAFAQEKGSIAGKIMDLEMENEPMLLANVRLKGGSKVTQTNFHGNFEFQDVLVGEHILVVSYAGYEELEIPVRVEKGKVVKITGGLAQKSIFLADVALNKKEPKSFTNSPGL